MLKKQLQAHQIMASVDWRYMIDQFLRAMYTIVPDRIQIHYEP